MCLGSHVKEAYTIAQDSSKILQRPKRQECDLQSLGTEILYRKLRSMADNYDDAIVHFHFDKVVIFYDQYDPYI